VAASAKKLTTNPTKDKRKRNPPKKQRLRNQNRKKKKKTLIRIGRSSLSLINCSAWRRRIQRRKKRGKRNSQEAAAKRDE
jgi:hypothetical protein